MINFDNYVIKIYSDNSFCGYLKKININNGIKNIIKTKNINSAIAYDTIIKCDIDRTYVELCCDDSLFYGEKYTFEIYKITIKEIRKSKLKKIKNKKNE